MGAPDPQRPVQLHSFEEEVAPKLTPTEQLFAYHVSEILKLVGHDPEDPNIADTPSRVAKAYLREWVSGYSRDPKDVATVFPNVGNEHSMVVVKDIPFFSQCSHHFAPFFGKAAVAYIPNQHVLGLSKFARILQVFSQRFQLQERITEQVADSICELLQPLGVMVVLYDVTHLCMVSRGVESHGAVTTTSALRGVFNDPVVRQEALSLMAFRQ